MLLFLTMKVYINIIFNSDAGVRTDVPAAVFFAPVRRIQMGTFLRENYEEVRNIGNIRRCVP
ncbi:MAG: hypothetical protein VR69_11300 [Peptococcaceae bacterium BRH_c4b]|nr:MAG: hypothetical protein VR69_11300 [Peptococcaceae bacterium BRH_c4b]